MGNSIPKNAPTDTDAVEELNQRLGALSPHQIRAWQAMTPARRLEIACQAYQFALDIIRLREKEAHPDLTPTELAWRVTRRMQGNPHLGK